MVDYAQVLAYIEGYWPRLVRRSPRQHGTRIGLPYPYMVPSDGTMFQEMYYWDSYFISLGLTGTPFEGLIVDMAENMAALYRKFGVIPNASRYYFLGRSQPPFFAAQVRLAFEVKQRRGDADACDFLRRLMRLAGQEHETVWLGTAQPHFRQVHLGLSRYFDVNPLRRPLARAPPCRPERHSLCAGAGLCLGGRDPGQQAAGRELAATRHRTRRHHPGADVGR